MFQPDSDTNGKLMSAHDCEFYGSTQRFTILVKTEHDHEETTSDIFH